MPVINYKNLKTQVPARNFDNKTLTTDYDFALQDASSNYGVMSFFKAVKSFFKGIAALGTLTATSRIPVTDSNGNVTYTTPNAIKSTLGLATTNELNSALVNYQPIVSKKLSGGEEWDTGIFLNKALSNYIDYHYKKSHLLLISTINGYGDTVSSRLIMLSIGRSANSITTTTIAEKSSTGSISILNYAQFVPSQETTEVNDNNTLVIKNSNTNSNYSFEIRFI